ncbi:MAG: DUF3592 domain-containing protein [Dehalococcoidales bacterium]|nr:DUF3592 domain-containing protein [Dehalococcoidales bacterium]
MNKRLLITFLAILGGIAFVGFGVFNLIQQGSYIETTAIVSNVEYDYDYAREETEVDITVKYTVDGKEYESLLNSTSTGYKIGDTLKIKYDPKDPSKVINSSKTYAFVAMGFGLVIVIAGVFSLLRGGR